MKKLVQIFLLGAMAIVFLGGCSSSPTDDDAQKAFQQGVDSVGNGLIKLVNIKKINGQKGQIQNREGMTVESYNFGYTAEIEAVKVCALLVSEKSLSTFNETDMASDLFKDLKLGEVGGELNGFKMNLGQRCVISGTIVFEKTENGWVCDKLEANFLDRIQ